MSRNHITHPPASGQFDDLSELFAINVVPRLFPLQLGNAKVELWDAEGNTFLEIDVEDNLWPVR